MRAFTLVEVMVSVAILAVLMLVTAQLISMSQRAWTRSSARLSQFREVRMAFDLMTKNLSQATLGSYWMDQLEDPSDISSAPANYIRKSELQFICGPAASVVPGGGAATSGHAVFFQAPLGIISLPANAGLANLLCGRGYFVQYGSDENFRPPFLNFLPGKMRFRLVEYSPSSEDNSIYSESGGTWFSDANEQISAAGTESIASHALTRPVADNIILLVISPRARTSATSAGDVSIAPDYQYDSRVVDNAYSTAFPGAQGSQNMLPPLLKIAMVAIDEQTAGRLEEDGELAGITAGVTFTSAINMDQNLQDLEQILLQQKANYRFFSTTISLNDSD